MIIAAAYNGKLKAAAKLLVPPLGALKVIVVSGSIPHLKHINVCRILFPSPRALLTMRMVHTDNRTAFFCLVLDSQKILVGFAGIIILTVDNVLNTPHIAVTAPFGKLCTVDKGKPVNLGKLLTVDVVVGNHKEIGLILFRLFNNLLQGESAVGSSCVAMRHTDIPFVIFVAHRYSPFVVLFFNSNIIYQINSVFNIKKFRSRIVFGIFFLWVYELLLFSCAHLKNDKQNGCQQAADLS